jgi:hypothetical protein
VESISTGLKYLEIIHPPGEGFNKAKKRII